MNSLLNAYGLYYASYPQFGEVGISPQASLVEIKHYLWIVQWDAIGYYDYE